VRCGNLAPARLGTASIPARTVPSTSDHSRSTASASISKIVTREMRQPCACPARHGQHSSAHRAQPVRPFPLDRLGVEQRARRLRRVKLG